MAENRPAPAKDHRPVIDRVAAVPSALIDEIIEEMAQRMSGTPEAGRTCGLSFAFHVEEPRIKPACYRVGPGGQVSLERGNIGAADFTFCATAGDLDLVLSGGTSLLGSLVRRRISMRGSVLHIRQLLRMVHAVETAYAAARAGIIERHSETYDFRI